MFLAFLSVLLATIIICFILLFLIMVAIATCYKLTVEPQKGICKSNAKLDGKTVLVTGGNQGIGLETARGLAARGAKVIIACRDQSKAAEAITDIINTTGNTDIEYKYLDLSSFRCIRKFAEDFNQTYNRLDILINNAGCADINCRITEDGLDLVMQVNYFGPFLLTNLLLDKVKASPAGRIIILSSFLYLFGRVTPKHLNGLHTNFFFKYANSKLCNMLWTKALAARLPKNVTVNCVHPGYVKTNIFKKLGRFCNMCSDFIIYLFNFKTTEEGAQTSIYLGVSEEVANVSGKYFMECKEVEYSKIVNDNELVEKIWDKSIILTSCT